VKAGMKNKFVVGYTGMTDKHGIKYGVVIIKPLIHLSV
jgi:hypothetical protein